MKQSRVLLLCYLFFVFSCSKEPISQINQETSLAQPHEVTEEIAQKVALSFIKENYYHETKSNNRVIKEHFTLNNQKGSDLLHVFNYENGGFTVIAGDNRLPPVLAYSDDTYFENSSIDFPLGLRIWINNIIHFPKNIIYILFKLHNS